MSAAVRYVQWWKNGDHPNDGVGKPRLDPATGKTYKAIEGAVVRFYRLPGEGEVVHSCGHTMHEHGWIDYAGGGETVCPGDWVSVGAPIHERATKTRPEGRPG